MPVPLFTIGVSGRLACKLEMKHEGMLREFVASPDAWGRGLLCGVAGGVDAKRSPYHPSV